MASRTSTGTPTVNPFLFNAQQFDQASANYYLRARYYDQSNGRFISQDPFKGVDEYPTSLHRYLYANCDPVDNIDPKGLYTPAFGYAVEAAVQARYSIDPSYAGDVAAGQVRFGQPVGIGSDPTLKPDIFNFAKRNYMEVKPLSPIGIRNAVKQMTAYNASFGNLGYYAEPDWQPTPNIFPVDGRNVLVFNVLGVIFYTTATDIENDVEEAQDVARSYGQIGRVRRLLRLESVRRSLQDDDITPDHIADVAGAFGITAVLFTRSAILGAAAAGEAEQQTEVAADVVLDLAA